MTTNPFFNNFGSSAEQELLDSIVVKSMVKSGDLKRVVVVKRKSGEHVIVDGHHTYTALRSSGIKNIPVRIFKEK